MIEWVVAGLQALGAVVLGLAWWGTRRDEPVTGLFGIAALLFAVIAFIQSMQIAGYL